MKRLFALLALVLCIGFIGAPLAHATNGPDGRSVTTMPPGDVLD